MDYIILDAGATAIQFSSGDVVVYGDEQEARDDMMSGDILVGISYCPDDDGGTDNSVQQYCKMKGVDNEEEYGDFVQQEGDDFQEKLKALFLPEID